MCDPRIMCRQHLLGEYRELFAIVGTLKRGISIAGYIRNNLIEPTSIRDRWLQLRDEMISRGYKTTKDLPGYELSHLPSQIRNYRVVRDDSLEDLISRCDACRQRYQKISKSRR
jgi:hypothetical protein